MRTEQHHTQGPLTVTRGNRDGLDALIIHQEGPADRYVAHIINPAEGLTAEDEANAKLIAAVTDFYAVAEKAAGFATFDVTYKPEQLVTFLQDLGQAARAALAKAEAR